MVQAREWVRRHPLRLAIYVLVLAASLAPVALAPLLLSRGGERLRSWLAERLGMGYTVESVRVSFLSSGCGPAANVRGLKLELLGEPPFNLEVDELLLCASRGLTARGVRASLASPLLEVDEIRFLRSGNRVETRGVRFLTDLLALEKLSSGPIRWEPARGALDIDDIAAEGVEVRLVRESDGQWNVGRARTLMGALGPLREKWRVGRETLSDLILKVRFGLLVALLSLAVAAVFLKFLLTSTLPRAARAALAFVPVVVPFGFHLLAGPAVTGFLILTLSTAVVLQRVFYRRGPEWHQRWEPFVLDLVFPPLILLLLAAHGLQLRLPSSLRVARLEAEVRQVSAVCQEVGKTVELGRLAVPACARAESLGLTLDLESLQVSQLDLGHSALSGIWQSPALSDALERLEFLSPPPSPLYLAADVNLTTSSRDAELALPCASRLSPGDVPRIAVAAAIALDTTRRDLHFKLGLGLQAPELDLEMKASGDPSQIRIESLSSGPASSLEIGRGWGALALGNPLTSRLVLEDVKFKPSPATLDSAEISAALPDPCNCGDWNVAAKLRNLEARLGRAYAVEVGGLDVGLRRRAGEGKDRLAARALAFQVALRGGERAIEADLPQAELEVLGECTKEPIPRALSGELRLRVGRAGAQSALVTENPLLFSIDAWRGGFAFPPQNARLRQSALALAPEQLNFRFAAGGRLESLVTPFLARGRMELELPPLVGESPVQVDWGKLFLNGSLTWDGQAPRVQARYESRGNRVRLRRPPGNLRLTEIRDLELRAEGNVPASRLGADLPAELSAWAEGVRRLARALPEEIDFSFGGGWPSAPLLKVETSDGGVLVEGADLRLGQLSVSDARLRDLSLDARLTGLRAVGETDGREVESTIGFSDGLLQIGAKLTGAAEPLRAELRFPPGKATVDFWALSLEPILPLVRPFLGGLGASTEALRGFIPHVAASLSNLTTGREIELALSPGARFSVDAGKQTLNLSIKGEPGSSDAALRVKAATGSDVHLGVFASGVEFDTQEAEGASQRMRLGLTTNATVAADEIDEIDGKLSGVTADLLDHAGKGLDLWGAVREPATAQASEIDWKLHLRNRPGEMALQSIGNAQQVRLSLADAEIRWKRSGQASDSRVSGFVDVLANIDTHRDHLVVDALVPAELQLSLAGAEPRALRFRLPVQLAFAPRLQEPEYYLDFWPGYPPALTRLAPACLLCGEPFALGPVSIQNLVLPSQPVRLAVGHGEHLILQAHFAGEALGGRVDSSTRSDIRWGERGATVTVRGDASLEHLQAATVGIAAEGKHLPLLEDAVEGEAHFAVDDLSLDPLNLRVLMDDPSRAVAKLALKLDLRRSPKADRSPGILQLSSESEVRLLNGLVEKILPGVRLRLPPYRLCYDDLRLSLEAEGGRVSTEPPLLRIDGLRIPCSNEPDVTTNVRVRFAGNKE